ncbi:hypothetical protein CURE108131_19165 [Cupriavidus respiraculi]|uniref:Uncharacterized protein n=1 Tax=Cupriavidus respiraculi TaxID=195930 RepID=A0ABM8XU54_9BURK|nr:hypothetical protein [Cupriavidus respiraculi]MBY4949511.1 hypothetical protein [Cupriavidus respiraculi]CAG9183883.1 hypothetical protein LMG21510_04969 [Cupriavidus respiraculi]
MPQAIDHIDAIARRKGRDVLYLVFFEQPDGSRVAVHWQHNESRAAVVQWLDREGYQWLPCGEIASESGFASYRGSIYVDTPYDCQDPRYLALQSYLEHPNGQLRFGGMRFLILPLDIAMGNAHHDEPGFWDKWADRF